MKLPVLLLCCMLAAQLSVYGQHYTPVIEPGGCPVKPAAGLITKCGYLVVPEDRHSVNGRKIRIPFFFVRRPEADSTKNITLFSTGGPGYSTIANYDSIKANFRFLDFGGFIAFNQRGTRYSEPCLDCPEINEAIKKSYREHRNRDSLVLLATRQCRERLLAQGIDLSAYNTEESAEDINDLRLALHIDSLNLLGISYSGGLMLTVAHNHPEGVRSLILDSPLPTYTNYDEHGLFNINEALDQVFDYYEQAPDSLRRYGNLKQRFREYFTGINGKEFSLLYRDSLHIYYTKNELLDAILDRLNTRQLSTVPSVIDDIINGRHDVYVKQQLDNYFGGPHTQATGMRFSVMCAEHLAYSDTALTARQHQLLPWLAGLRYNNVNHAICDCWKVKKAPASAKLPLYSSIPALITAGDIDPWCRPFYNRLIKRGMPNSQLLLFRRRGHMPGFFIAGTDYLELFMRHPFNEIVSTSNDLIIE